MTALTDKKVLLEVAELKVHFNILSDKINSDLAAAENSESSRWCDTTAV